MEQIPQKKKHQAVHLENHNKIKTSAKTQPFKEKSQDPKPEQQQQCNTNLHKHFAGSPLPYPENHFPHEKNEKLKRPRWPQIE